VSNKDKAQEAEKAKAAIRKEIATLEARLTALESGADKTPPEYTSNAELLTIIEKLQESENQFLAFLENSPSAAAIKDIDGTFLIVNRVWREWFGSDGKELVGKKAVDVFSADFAKEMVDQDARVVETGETFEIEVQTPYSDGTTRTTILQKFPIKDSEGNFVAIGGTNTDISKHKSIEAELLKNEAILKDAIESIPEGFALYDADDRLVIFNQNFVKNREGLKDILRVGITFEEQLILREKTGIRDKLHLNINKIPASERIHRHQNPTGEPKDEHRSDGTTVQTLEVRTPNGGIAQIRTDITRLKNAEDALKQSYEELERRVEERTAHLELEVAARKQSQALMQNLIDSIPEGFVYYDENDRLALINSKYAEGRKGIEDALKIGSTFESIFYEFNSNSPNKYIFEKKQISNEERHLD
jgi:PAS domain S-box-containing protein